MNTGSELTSKIKPIVDGAISCYETYNAKTSSKKNYCDSYANDIQAVKKLFNVFLITEWTRLVEESTAGEKLAPGRWFALYDEHMSRYEKYYSEYYIATLEKNG